VHIHTTMDCIHIKVEPADSIDEAMEHAPPTAPSTLEQTLQDPIKVEGALEEPYTSQVDTHTGSQTDVSTFS
jgi:hypothetical protein